MIWHSPIQKPQLRNIALLFATLAAWVFAVGCDGPKGTVTGSVKYKDQVVKGGTVTFVGADGKGGGSSPIAEDGTYTITDVPVGDMKIAVETVSMKPSGMDKGHQYKPPKEAPPEAAGGMPGGKAKDRFVPIPDSYSDVHTSGLTYTVKPGKQDYPIVLK
jgi:hypothetical protein